MSNTLIIGYGNPLRGDDGLGWVAAEMLAERLAAVSILTCHQLTPELAEPISRVDRVIFIDAAAVGEPGEIVCHTIEPFLPASGPFSHTCDPAGLLQMAQMLYGRSPYGYLFTVTGASFGYEEKLSAAVTAALPRLYDKIEALSRRAGFTHQTANHCCDGPHRHQPDYPPGGRQSDPGTGQPVGACRR
jgi:hydrogenase maturation protease